MANVVADWLTEAGFIVERIDQIDASATANTVVIFTVGGGDVHNASAIAGADKVIGEDLKRIGLIGKVGEQRFVVASHEAHCPLIGRRLHSRFSFFVVGAHARFGHDVDGIALASLIAT